MRVDPSIFGNWVISFLRVTGSTVYGPHNAVLMGGDSGVGSTDQDDLDGGEESQDAEAYGAPGVVFRPRPPEKVSTPDGTETIATEAMGARTSDGLLPLAWRDLRFNRAFPNPKPGTVALVGYGGGFLAFDDGEFKVPDPAQPEKKFASSIQTLYCPYDFDANGDPGKAMSIVVDPDLEAISIIHGEGQSILMQKDKSITLQSAAASSFLRMDDDMMWLSSKFLVLQAGATVVGDPANPLLAPLAPGVSCPRLFLAPTA